MPEIDLTIEPEETGTLKTNLTISDLIKIKKEENPFGIKEYADSQIKETENASSDTFQIEDFFYTAEKYFDNNDKTDFEVTSTDIEELDIFIKFAGKMYLESIAHINIHSASNLETIFALGSPIMIDAVSGVKMYAGKIIINALQNQIPLAKLCAIQRCDIYELSSFDLFIVPKNSEKKYASKYAGLQIKNIKIKDWFSDKSTENPGSFFVLTYVAPFANLLGLPDTKQKIEANITNPLEYKYKISEYDIYLTDINTFKSIFKSDEWKKYIKTILDNGSGASDEFKTITLRNMPMIYDAIFTHLIYNNGGVNNV